MLHNNHLNYLVKAQFFYTMIEKELFFGAFNVIKKSELMTGKCCIPKIKYLLMAKFQLMYKFHKSLFGKYIRKNKI